jgi:hypothetical protein
MPKVPYDPGLRRVPKSCSSVLEQLINYEVLRLDNNLNNAVLGKAGKETGLFELWHSTDHKKTLLVRKTPFIKVRELRGHVLLKISKS